MEDESVLTEVFVNVWMFLKQNAVDLELDLVDFFALFVVVHSHSELVAFVSEIIWDMEGLSKALCIPALPRLTIDVERDHATSQILFNRDWISSSFDKDWEVFAVYGGSIVTISY